MNKRQMKKRRKLRSITVGNRVYTHKEIAMINKAHMGYVNMCFLYSQIKNLKLTRPRARALINYVYKDRIKRIARNGDMYLSYNYLRFARHLNEVNSATKTPVACNGGRLIYE